MSNTPIKQQPTEKRTSRRGPDWWIYVIPVLILLVVVFHIILYKRPGKAAIAIYYLGPLLVTFLACLFLLVGLIYSAIKRPFLSKWRVLGFAGLLLFPLVLLLRQEQSGTFFSAYPSSHAGAISSVAFRVPFDTPITVGWGGDNAVNNYHVTAPDQRWAYDLLVTKEGRSFVGDSTMVENYLCYGLPILAPAAGEVVAVFDSVQNMRIGDLSETEHVGGNQIILKVAEREFLFLCHLRPNSVTVRKGDKVQQGQLIAQVGNSGHTSEPHLHIHLQDTQEDNFGEGVPLYFHNYVTSGKLVTRGMPTGGFSEAGISIGQIVQHRR